MSLIERIASWAGFEPIKNAGIPITEYTRGSEAWNDMFGPMQLGLPAPSRHTAMTSTAIYACANLISSAIMAMPVNLYSIDVKTGERDRNYVDPLNWLLNEEFSPRWPSSAGWEFLASSLLFEGDGFAKIRRDPRTAQPIGLEPWHPWRVQNGPTADGSRMVYRFDPEFINGVTIGKVEILDQDDVLHIPGFGFDGWRGLTPLRHSLRNAGALAIATQDYAGNFFANSARPDFALQTDQNLGPDKIKEYQDRLDERHRTPANAHRPMILGGGLKIQTWSLSATDMQLLSTRQFQIEEIARAYGVPPFMIGHTQNNTSWGSGVEAMGKGFVRYTLRQYLHKFEVELNRKLFRTASRKVEFDTSDLERADTTALTNSLRVAVGRAGETRLMSVDEARAVLRLKKGGDAASAALGINPAAAGGGSNPLPADNEGAKDEKSPA